MHGSLSGAYRVQNVAARNRVVLTNRCPTGLNRGFGGPQLYLALEGTMNVAAGRLGLDPAELRRRNLIGADEFPYRTPSGGLYDSGDYEACLDHALELAGYEERRDEQADARAAGRSLGIGVACVVEPSISNMGYITLAQTAAERAQALPKSGNAEGASVIVSPLGGITVRIGTTPQGQGHRTVAAQVVADALGVAPEDVDVLTDIDTSTSAWSVASGNYSSRFSGVGAARGAPRRDEGRREAAGDRRRAQLDGDAGRRRAPRRAGLARRGERLAAAARRHGALEPPRAAARARARPPRDRVLRAAEPRASGRRRPHRLVGRPRLHRRRGRRRGRSRDRRRSTCSTT